MCVCEREREEALCALGMSRMDGQDGWLVGRISRSRWPVDLCPTLPLPMDLHPDIYYSEYYRARAFIALGQMPGALSHFA